MSRSSYPAAEQIRIKIPRNAKTMKEVIDVTSSALREALDKYPAKITGARRRIQTLMVDWKSPDPKVIYEVGYSTDAADSYR